MSPTSGRNRSDSGTVLTFTTGAPLPATTIEGTVVDWTHQPARLPVPWSRRVLLPDSLPYRGARRFQRPLQLRPAARG